jgi:protein-disulfide isomerase
MRISHLLRAIAAVGVLALASPVVAQNLTAAQKVEVEGVIKDYLMRNPEILREALVELQRKEKAAEVQARAKVIADPSSPLFTSENNAVVGNPNGKYVLVEFFDYNCGYCKRALSDLTALVKTEPELKVLLRDFPVLGPKSVEAAEVAIAVKKQLKGEKFFDFHQKLLSSRGQVGRAQALAVAKDAGVDMVKLAADLESPATKAAVAEGLELGDSLGLTGTPSYVVGKEVVVGAVGLDELKSHLADAKK